MPFNFTDEAPAMMHPLDYDLLLFDADGTLRRCHAHSTATAHAPCHNGPGEWEVIPGVPAVLATYDWSRVGFGLATNQGGIGLGYTTEVTCRAECRALLRQLFPHAPRTRPGGPLLRCPWSWTEPMAEVRLAPASPDASSPERKPSPWMLLDLVRAYGGRLDRTLYVGDSDIDAEAAARAGVAFAWAWAFFGWPARPPNAQRYDTPRREETPP